MSDDTRNVFNLRTGKPAAAPGAPNQALVSLLEDILGMAKDGRLQNLWGAGFTHEGLRLVIKAGHHDNVYEFAGSLEFLADEYRDMVIETSHPLKGD